MKKPAGIMHQLLPINPTIAQYSVFEDLTYGGDTTR